MVWVNYVQIDYCTFYTISRSQKSNSMSVWSQTRPDSAKHTTSHSHKVSSDASVTPAMTLSTLSACRRPYLGRKTHAGTTLSASSIQGNQDSLMKACQSACKTRKHIFINCHVDWKTHKETQMPTYSTWEPFTEIHWVSRDIAGVLPIYTVIFFLLEPLVKNPLFTKIRLI